MRLAILALLLLASPAVAQPPPLVAPTDALSPAEELKGFTVPAGFEVQLVASEPQIQKPMQLAFDAKGRMWVTTSHHYPFAVPQGQGTDKLFLLSDIDPATGKAGKVQVFADDLNIPIGVLPLPDCKSCIVSSTGEIRKYTDTNDDGKADKMEVLFSGFGFVDTHGMTNSFTLMPDGWVYACHGFRNDSKVKGKDGHEVVMNSGNTFRFRPDGSRIEVYTRGQVNPFGIAVDPWFNLYTADCHSKPITQLIPGATYQSFGKPHDGLGFGPHVTRHDHASTGLCGLAWYDADQFPKDYLGCMFVGNVVTSRINFDRIEWKGATPVAKELPDFMTSKDLWFRPVDIKLGPDGALYVCDFYNKIIGHYEVDLKHPGRDKDHGRLWRIVWKGQGAKPAKMAFADLQKATMKEVVDLMLHDNLTVRFLSGHELRVRMLREPQPTSTPFDREKARAFPERTAALAGWMGAILESVDKLPKATDYGYLRLLSVLGQDLKKINPENMSGHVLRALNVRKNWGDKEREVLREYFVRASSAHDQRAAVEVIIFHPHADFVAPLVEVIKSCPPDDTHLRLAARIALRNCLRDDEKAWPNPQDMSDPKVQIEPAFVDVALAIPSEKAAVFLWELTRSRKLPAGVALAAVAEHIARYSPPDKLDQFVGLFLRVPANRFDPEAVLGVFRGVQARGKRLNIRKSIDVIEPAYEELHRLETEQRLTADDFKRLAGIMRVLAAIPGITEDWKELNAPRLVKALEGFVTRNGVPLDLRSGASDALLKLTPTAALTSLRAILIDASAPAELRDRLLLVFASSALKDARLDARDALKDAPFRTAVAVGTALAGTPAGAEDLLDAVKQGKAPARLLQEKLILERLRAAKLPDLDKQIGALTKGLPPLDQKIAELMKKRATAFASAKPDKEAGAKLFVKHCGACHKIGETGGKIAPQLDGVGNRGLERLLEDTLDPNRNVDQAFRARIITTKDERTITGLMLRVEGEVVIIADDQGKEIRIPTKDIDTNRETMLSPMPANIAEAVTEAEFHHLMAYLLDQKAKDPPKK